MFLVFFLRHDRTAVGFLQSSVFLLGGPGEDIIIMMFVSVKLFATCSLVGVNELLLTP